MGICNSFPIRIKVQYPIKDVIYGKWHYFLFGIHLHTYTNRDKHTNKVGLLSTSLGQFKNYLFRMIKHHKGTIMILLLQNVIQYQAISTLMVFRMINVLDTFRFNFKILQPFIQVTVNNHKLQ